MTLSKLVKYTATVPSNIAFLKYWGKSDEARQWPANDSLSMTLEGLNSQTEARIIQGTDHQVTLNGQLLQQHESGVGEKIFSHLDLLARELGRTESLAIDSVNSFPTGCGIASSASGLGALTLAAAAAWTGSRCLDSLGRAVGEGQLIRWARLGSGSACRSLHGGIVHWRRGEDADDQDVVQAFSERHWPLMDSVVLFSKTQKTVSSTEAHRGAWTSPLFAPRLAGLQHRLEAMKAAIEERSMSRLGPLLEQETLEMHGVIMSATPPVKYFQKETGEFLAWLRRRREELGLELYFTLDAGPNVHLIYENHLHEQVMKLLGEKISQDRILSDNMGSGPLLTSEDL